MGKDCGKAECFVENPNDSVGIPVKILGIGQGSGSFRGKKRQKRPGSGEKCKADQHSGSKALPRKQLFKRLNYRSSERGGDTPVRILESSSGFS